MATRMLCSNSLFTCKRVLSLLSGNRCASEIAYFPESPPIQGETINMVYLSQDLGSYLGTSKCS